MDRFICALSLLTILVIGFQGECQARPGYSRDYSDYDYEYKEDQSSHYLDKSVSDHTDGDIDDRDEYSESSYAPDYDMISRGSSEEQAHPIMSREVDIDAIGGLDVESRYMPLIQVIDDAKTEEQVVPVYSGEEDTAVHGLPVYGGEEDTAVHGLPVYGGEEDTAVHALPVYGGEEDTAVHALPVYGGEEDTAVHALPVYGGEEDTAVHALPVYGREEDTAAHESYYDSEDEMQEEYQDQMPDDYTYLDYNIDDFPTFHDVESVLAEELHNADEQEEHEDIDYLDAKDQSIEEDEDKNSNEKSIMAQFIDDMKEKIKKLQKKKNQQSEEVTEPSSTLPSTTVSTEKVSTSQTEVHSTTSRPSTPSKPTSIIVNNPVSSSTVSDAAQATDKTSKKRQKGSRKNKGDGKKTKGSKKGKDIETRAVLDGSMFADDEAAVAAKPRSEGAKRASEFTVSGPACSEPRILPHEDAVIEILLFDHVVTTLNSPHIGVHGYVMRMMPPPPNPDVINNAVAIMFMFSKPFVMTGIYLGNNLNEQESTGLQGATTTLRSFWVQVAESDDPGAAWKTLGSTNIPIVYHVRAGMVRFDTPITVQVLKLYPQMWDDQPMISSPLLEGCRMPKIKPGRGNKNNSATKNGR